MLKRVKRIFLTVALTVSFLMPLMPNISAQTDMSRDDFDEILKTYSIDDSIPPYYDYISLYRPERSNSTIVIDANDFTRFGDDDSKVMPETFIDFEGMSGTSVLTSETSMIEYDFYVSETSYYDIVVDYYPIEGKGSAIQRSFFIDGQLPYNEMALVELNRVWQNDQISSIVESGLDFAEVSWEKDNQGNDLKPIMFETPEWISSYLYDSSGYVAEPMSLYLTEGKHTITINSVREPLLLRRITFNNVRNEPSYSEIKNTWDNMGATDTKGIVVAIEAENASKTSSQMLYPIQDQSSPAVTPSSTKALLNNTIGGNSWRYCGQWVEWIFSVPETGYYELTLHDKQNFKQGTYVSRRISIDGKIPFSELNDYGFTYTQNWRVDKLSDDSGVAFKFYLEEGEHTLRMEAVLGEFGEIVSTVRDAVYELNSIYRSVIVRTGISPDKYADYQIEKNLPELTNKLIAVRDKLSWSIDEMRRISGRQSERERVLVSMRDQLNDLIKDNEKFPRVLSSFKVNIRACGTWLNEAVEQPFQLDTIYFHSPDVEVKIKNSSWFQKVIYEFARLIYSFIVDYNQVGNVADKNNYYTINLWIGSGRDQANIIKSLIDRSFSVDTGINVNVMLVDMSTLLQASLAGQGPDVAIQVSGELPMNFGLRGSVADLSGFQDFQEVRRRFAESAMTPYEFDGACYALPETQIFPMMFYRKDILAELNMELPQTWDDVSVIMSELSFNNMEFGMLPSEQIFSMLLYQNGGQYYNENATLSALDSEAAINAFKKYTEFYTDYKLERETSVEERFRTGETPIIIADYTFYNNLQVSAPDLKGIWGLAPVPGTLQSDGTIDRSVCSNAGSAVAATTMIGVTGGNGGACVMMESSEKKKQVWSFMTWWTSTETQLDFGREMESLMGPSARIPTANIEAFSALPWPDADYKALMDQFQYVMGIPQVPGGYYTYRNVNNAFYSVTTPLTDRPAGKNIMANPREELMDKVILINDEIRYKRIEFGMPLD